MTPRRSRRRVLASTVAILVAVLLAGCGWEIPRDPDGTLSRITHGELRVGVVPEPGLIELGTDGIPEGPLIDLTEDFADELDAAITWTAAGDEKLVDLLEAGDLDLIIGGFTEATPWVDRAGVTRGYTGVPGSDGRRLVMLVPLGENAFLSALEEFLDEEVGS